jgi:hypothetical protein
MVAREGFREPLALPWLGVIEARGPDAVSFLQGQLTNDTRLLADGRTQLAALNSPQGRVIALLRLKQVDGSVYALLPRELVEPVLTRLKKYVLRAKVQLASPALVAVGSASETSPDPANSISFDYGPGRRVTVLPAAELPGTASDRDLWIAEDIRLGLPQVFASTSEAFIPQMLNLDLLEGISFSKGCYTGQEIVVRTQHLGRIKRRTLRYRLEAGPLLEPLQGLFLNDAKVAEVLISAGTAAGHELLAVTNLDARDRALRATDGREARPLPMPYAMDGS